MKKIFVTLLVIALIAVAIIIWSNQPSKATINKVSSTNSSEEVLEKTEEMGEIFRWKYTSDWELRVETNTDERAVARLLPKSIGGDMYTLVVKKSVEPISEDTGYILRIGRGDKKENINWKIGEAELFTSVDGLERVLFGSNNGYNYTLAQVSRSNETDEESLLMEAISSGIQIGPKTK